MGIVLVLAITAGILRAAAGTWDFGWFYGDACVLNKGVDLTQSMFLEWYLPGFRILLIPLAWMSKWPAAIVWNGINLLTALLVLYGLWRLAKVRRQAEGLGEGSDFSTDVHSRAVVCVGFLVICPLIFNTLQINQISFWPLSLLVLASVVDKPGKWLGSGILLGLAIFVKIVPGLLLVWCLLRRKFKMALCAAILPFALSFTIDTLTAGNLTSVWNHHVHWYHISVGNSSNAKFLERHVQQDHGNQGMASVLGRLLAPAPTKSRSTPFHSGKFGHVRQVNLMSLDTRTITWIYYGMMFVTLSVLVWVTVRFNREDSPWIRHGLFALWCSAMLWFAPLVRMYHLMWVLPAVCWLVDRATWHRREGTSQMVCLVAVVAWIVAIVGWALAETRAIGLQQWVNLLTMACLAWEIRAASRLFDIKEHSLTVASH